MSMSRISVEAALVQKSLKLGNLVLTKADAKALIDRDIEAGLCFQIGDELTYIDGLVDGDEE